MSVRFKTDFDKYVVVANLKRRGWEEVTCVLDEDWDIYWASVQSAKSVFGPDSVRLQPGQLINHFPNHYELTRKDLMVKNIKRYQRQQRREAHGHSMHGEELDIIPATYVLPQDYALFVEEYRKAPNTTWIMKPSSKSQGKGIFLINKLSQVKKWCGSAALPPALRSGADNYVVSRYIDNPLLIGGKKFDMRLYVVVTSFKPLQVYLSRLGFGRFCNVKYTPGAEELDNEFVHLTNVAIQKQGSDYNDRHGNKWTLDNVRLYLEAVKGPEQTQQLFREIEAVIVKSLKACQNTIINDRHCFELYGYDIIVDDTLRPWLIEVNASPSLTTTTQSDRLLKFKVINDALNIVTPLDWLPLTQTTGAPADQLPSLHRLGRRDKVGSFHLIYDEELEAERSATLGSGAQAHGHSSAHGGGHANAGSYSFGYPAGVSYSTYNAGGGGAAAGGRPRSEERRRPGSALVPGAGPYGGVSSATASAAASAALRGSRAISARDAPKQALAGRPQQLT